MNYFKCLTLIAVLVGSISSIPLSALQNNFQATIQSIDQEKDVTNLFRAYYPNKDIARKAAITFHAQLHEANYEAGYLIFELTPEEQKQLRAFDFTFKPATDFIERRNKRLDDIRQSLIQRAQSSDDPVEQFSIPGYPCYETVEETFAVADGIVSSNPNLAEFIDVGDSWVKTQGSGGYDIKVLILTNKSTGGDKPILFVNSAIHAREYTTAPLMMAFARELIDGYNVNADATWLLDHHEIHLMLQTNPDGRKRAETGISWRKNANENYCSPTSNRRGADLNRNFTDRWNITNGSGSSGNQCNATYRGPSAGSEPEIQALESYVRSLFPDRRGPDDNDAAPDDTSGIHLDIHSFSELVLWPWGDKRTPAPNGAEMQSLGRKFAFFNGYEPQQSIGLYATDGTSDSVSYGELGVPAFTFELGTSFFQSCNAFNNQIKPDNLPALMYAAKVVRTPYITPSGPDVTSLSLSDSAASGGVAQGTPVAINASVTDTRFSNRNGTESTQNISEAEYYINTPPWENGANAFALDASDGSYNERTEEVAGTINTAGLTAGKYIVYVRSRDTSGTWGAVTAEFLIINDDQPPALNADFRVNCTELSCNFDASNSTGASSFSWAFGDGSSGAGEFTQHTYSAEGSYNVTLTVSNGTDSDSQTVAVSVSQTPPPVLDADFTSSCSELVCNFDASQSVGANRFDWTFGDGSSNSGETTQHVYSTSGSFTVTLTVSNGSASDSVSKTVIVSAPPPTDIEMTLSSGQFLFFRFVNVNWSGANSNSVDIYRNGNIITTTANDGFYRNFAGRGSYIYKVCEQGSTTNCSSEQAIDL